MCRLLSRCVSLLCFQEEQRQQQLHQQQQQQQQVWGNMNNVNMDHATAPAMTRTTSNYDPSVALLWNDFAAPTDPSIHGLLVASTYLLADPRLGMLAPQWRLPGDICTPPSQSGCCTDFYRKSLQLLGVVPANVCSCCVHGNRLPRFFEVFQL